MLIAIVTSSTMLKFPDVNVFVFWTYYLRQIMSI